MDYYGDYHLEKIRSRGMDVRNVVDSCIATLFSPVVAPAVTCLKRAYLSNDVKLIDKDGHHCSTVALCSEKGDVYFGRNFDYGNDACLILRVHDRDGVASIAVIDLAYLNLNRSDLDQTSLIRRVPLLFAPYYVMDGMNRYGVAVSDMTVAPAKPPFDPARPDIIQSTLERLILDGAKNVEEAVEMVRAYNVHFAVVTEHLMVADASRQSRIIEFVDGEVKVIPPERTWQVCTNSPIWNRSESQRSEACPRYRAGTDAAEKLGRAFDYPAACQVARSMSVEKGTMWESVYNLTAREARIFYKARPGAEYRDAISE